MINFIIILGWYDPLLFLFSSKMGYLKIRTFFMEIFFFLGGGGVIYNIVLRNW